MIGPKECALCVAVGAYVPSGVNIRVEDDMETVLKELAED
jgi:hypothetical protein